MTDHSTILAWRIPWTEEPCGLQSLGLQRVRHDWSDLAGKKKKKVEFKYWDMYILALMGQLPDLSFSQQGGKHLENFYILCVRNYAKTLTNSPTDLQVLSHWATGLPIVIHSVAKTASISGPLHAALTLGENGWESGKNVTSDQGEEMSNSWHPLVAQTIDRSAHHLTFSFFFADTRMALIPLCSIFTLNSWTEHEIPAKERFQDSHFWLMLGQYLNQNLKEMEILHIYFLK